MLSNKGGSSLDRSLTGADAILLLFKYSWSLSLVPSTFSFNHTFILIDILWIWNRNKP